MKNILIPTDFSDNAYNALFYMSKLLKDETCNFVLLNVYNGHTKLHQAINGEHKNEGLFGLLKNESYESLEKTFHRINLDHKSENHQFKLIAEQGELIAIITKVVSKYSIDLIVMGNRGVNAKKSIFWGSTTYKVVKSIRNCPVLAIPEELEFSRPIEIGFATNYKKMYSAKMILPLKNMAVNCNAAIRIVHVNEEKYLSPIQEVNFKTLISYLYAMEHTVHWMPNFSSKTEAIKMFMEELGIGMLTMVNSEHSLLETLLNEPVVKNLTQKLNLPFLIIPDTD